MTPLTNNHDMMALPSLYHGASTVPFCTKVMSKNHGIYTWYMVQKKTKKHGNNSIFWKGW